MISTTRREAMMGALAVPAVAGLPLGGARAMPSLLLHDAALSAGRRLAAAHDGQTLAIEGDRIRFARAVFERRPSLVVGISRPADALQIEDVGREAGYVPVTTGTEAWRDMIAASEPRDRGLVLGWVLAPRS